jgi:lipopolysaccharide transport system ATP-binding protein
MSDIAISVENLSKSYLLGHNARREGYTALRDVIARHAHNLVRKTRDMVSGRQIVQGDEVEEFWALRDVSFEVKRGEVLGIIGRNGAGKSTLLKILSRITEPSEGRVKISGRVASLLEVGTGFHPELTGRENIFLNGAILGMNRKEIKRKFDEIVAFADVENFLDTPVKRYSSGMYVRLAFAIAGHLDSEILIIDEVLSVGDALFQRKCLDKMRSVTQEGRTVLFVSHDLMTVSSLCETGILLAGGRIAFSGPAESAIREYASGSESNYSLEFAPNPVRPSICGVHVEAEALAERNLIVDISFESPRPLSFVNGAVLLRTVSGAVVWASNARFHPPEQPIRGVANGTIRCEARNLPLVPEDYLLSVWLGDWHEDHDVKRDALRLTLGRESTGQSIRPPAHVSGYVDWPASWSKVQTGSGPAN